MHCACAVHIYNSKINITAVPMNRSAEMNEWEAIVSGSKTIRVRTDYFQWRRLFIIIINQQICVHYILTRTFKISYHLNGWQYLWIQIQTFHKSFSTHIVHVCSVQLCMVSLSSGSYHTDLYIKSASIHWKVFRNSIPRNHRRTLKYQWLILILLISAIRKMNAYCIEFVEKWLQKRRHNSFRFSWHENPSE